MVTDRDLYLFDLRGFLVIPQALSADEVGELNRVLDKNIERPPGETLGSQVFHDFLLWGDGLRALLAHKRVMPLLRRVIDEEPRLDRYYGLHMLPGMTGVPLHGGAKDVEDMSEYYSVVDGRPRSGITTVCWALTDMLAEHGGFACIPGSHKSGLRRPADLDETECLEHVPLRAGDVLVFTGAISHRGTRWAGPHARRSLLFKYAPRHIAWGRFYLSWPRELVDALDAEQRRLFAPPHCFRGDGIGVG
ncbi:MAG TPA: phytanoyl-CoA dioxygenase family protein [Pyrinomonadaceae bacterium]|nr:phytanoyl-CoA dioxygenase family protein [Pyrinomonadaceae bacterium]